jgi:hypothetical protein
MALDQSAGELDQPCSRALTQMATRSPFSRNIVTRAASDQVAVSPTAVSLVRWGVKVEAVYLMTYQTFEDMTADHPV